MTGSAPGGELSGAGATRQEDQAQPWAIDTQEGQAISIGHLANLKEGSDSFQSYNEFKGRICGSKY